MENRPPRVKDTAPFASFEADLSDESPQNENLKFNTNLPNIKEEMKKNVNSIKNNANNITPRIDISAAVFHQDDNFGTEILTSANKSKLNLETTSTAADEMTSSELHSSTEELSFRDLSDAEKKKKRLQSQQAITDIQLECRKDSGCSDIGLLSISGRTSRVSSVGSVASGGSGLSNVSHLSATSNLSKCSRGSSPHRMQLETSFCGPKPIPNISVDDCDESIKMIISDKLNDNLSINIPDAVASLSNSRAPSPNISNKSDRSTSSTRSNRKKPVLENPKTQKFISLYSDEEDETPPQNSKPQVIQKSKIDNPKPVIENPTQKFISLHSFDSEDGGSGKTCKPNPFSPKRLKPFTNSTLVNFISKYDSGGKIIKDSDLKRNDNNESRKSSGEIKPVLNINEEFQKFIELPDDDDGKPIPIHNSKNHKRSISSVYGSNTQITIPVEVHSVRSPPEDGQSDSRQQDDRQDNNLQIIKSIIPLTGSAESFLNSDENNLGSKNNFLTVSSADMNFRSHSDDGDLSKISPSLSPNSEKHFNRPTHLELAYSNRSAKSMTHLGKEDFRTPSPSASKSGIKQLLRRCSHNELRGTDKSKSRSGSIKSLFSSIFKRGESVHNKTARSKSNVYELSDRGLIPNTNIATIQKSIKNKEPDSIIIPLHSPDSIKALEMAELQPEEGSGLPIIKVTSDHKKDEELCGAPEPEENTDEVKAETVKSEDTKSNDFNSTEVPKNQQITTTTVTYIDTASQTILRYNIRKAFGKFEDVVSDEDDQKSDEGDKIKTSPRASKNLECENSNPVSVHSSTSQDVNTKTDIESGQNILQKTENSNKESPVQDQDVNNKTETNEKDSNEIFGSTDSDICVPAILKTLEDENKELISQMESFDDDLPFVPTTLPLERSVAVPILPVKERRVNEVVTCSVDRPHSSTMLNPALLDDFVAATNLSTATTTTENFSPLHHHHSSSEKLHITLPRSEIPQENTKTKSPSSKKPWTKFAEESGIPQSPRKQKLNVENNQKESPPPLPPKKNTNTGWVSFDEFGQEIRQSPKRITMLPSSHYAAESKVSLQKAVSRFNQKMVVVNPDECSCECHEAQSNLDDKNYGS